MARDSITDEIREIRRQLAAEQGNDISRIGDELRRREKASGRRVVRLLKRVSPRKATKNASI